MCARWSLYVAFLFFQGGGGGKAVVDASEPSKGIIKPAEFVLKTKKKKKGKGKKGKTVIFLPLLVQSLRTRMGTTSFTKKKAPAGL